MDTLAVVLMLTALNCVWWLTSSRCAQDTRSSSSSREKSIRRIATSERKTNASVANPHDSVVQSLKMFLAAVAAAAVVVLLVSESQRSAHGHRRRRHRRRKRRRWWPRQTETAIQHAHHRNIIGANYHAYQTSLVCLVTSKAQLMMLLSLRLSNTLHVGQVRQFSRSHAFSFLFQVKNREVHQLLKKKIIIIII